jgi:hypothetical protein
LTRGFEHAAHFGMNERAANIDTPMRCLAPRGTATMSRCTECPRRMPASKPLATMSTIRFSIEISIAMSGKRFRKSAWKGWISEANAM